MWWLLACHATGPLLSGPPDIVLLVPVGLRASPEEGGGEAALYEGMGRQPAIRWGDAYAQSCVPFTSLGSMLAGRYPSAMAMCAHYDVNALAIPGGDRPWCARIPEETWTIPEVLHVYGYETAAYVARASTEKSTDWNQVIKQTGAWWSAHADHPRFYLILTMDPYLLQYDPAVGFQEHSSDQDRRNVEVSTETLRKLYADRAHVTGEGFSRLLSESLVASTERPLQVWLTSTNGLSLREETGLKSDHLKAVTNSVIVDRTVHVPLARLIPGDPGEEERDQVVELLDLLPTLIHQAGGNVPAEAEGADLLGEGGDGRAYMEFGDMIALREGPDLLTFRFFLHNASSLDPRLTEGLFQPGINFNFYALHDVVNDPLQTRDLATARLERTSALRSEMQEIRKNEAAPPPDMMTPEHIQILEEARANGYW